jgi:ribosome maturation factor RimP
MNERPTTEEIIAKIRALTLPLTDQMGLELVDIDYKTGGNFLRVFIDRPGKGVSMDDCSKLSRALSSELDTNDPIPHRYNLEVSSPGLDRPLKKEEDFIRHSGKLAKIILIQPLNEQTAFTGRIGEVQNGMVKIILEDMESVWLPLSQVKKAHLEVELKKKQHQDHIHI